MDITLVQGCAAIVSLCGAYVAIKRVIKSESKDTKELIAEEMKVIAEWQKSLNEENATLKTRLEALTLSLGEAKGEIKALRFSVSEFEGGIKSAMKENTEVLRELKLSKAEWITKELLKIKGDKKSG